MSIPFGEIVIQWWETGNADPDAAHDWLTEQAHALEQRFAAEFPQVVARTTVDT